METAMATAPPTGFITIFVVVFIISGGIMRSAKGQAPGQGSWCVAKPSASDEELQNNVNYACNYVNCNIIQKRGVCFEPQTLINHASVAMNLYYQKQRRNYWNCFFSNSAIISVIDPSYQDCKYEYEQ